MPVESDREKEVEENKGGWGGGREVEVVAQKQQAATSLPGVISADYVIRNIHTDRRNLHLSPLVLAKSCMLCQSLRL